MAAIPKNETTQTVEAIYTWWSGRLNEPRRGYLGGSVIGQECERRLWYGFRWCDPPAAEAFDGRMARLFDRGHREETVFVQELRGIGLTVHDVDPNTGRQFSFKAVAGHFGGSIDGVALGVLEAPKTWHLLEMKTHNARSFGELEKHGVEKSKPEHAAQMQIYMHMAQLDRALYLAVNKDNDSLWSTRLRRDPAEGERLLAKAERVIFTPEPLPRLSEDPAFFKCKFCPAAAVCHGERLPPVSCRTCLHATPEREGDGRWTCAKYGADIPLHAQRDGCDSHLYVPALLARWGEVEDASEAEGWVQYKSADGLSFRNGPWGPESFSSRELAACSGPAVLRDAEFLEIRAKYQGKVVDYEEAA